MAPDAYALASRSCPDRLRAEKPGVQGQWPTDDPRPFALRAARLQRLLIARGYDVGEPGAVGQKTRDAIMRDRKQIGMPRAAGWDQKVLRALRG